MVRLGDLNLYDDSDKTVPVDVPIVAKMVHEDYNPTLFMNDIAILRLRNPVRFTCKSSQRVINLLIYNHVHLH